MFSRTRLFYMICTTENELMYILSVPVLCLTAHTRNCLISLNEVETSLYPFINTVLMNGDCIKQKKKIIM